MLSEPEAQQARPKSKPYKLTDSGGLCLFVSPHGTKSFRYNYRFNGKRQTLTIGKYPGVSLEDARARHAEARKALVQGINPAQKKREEKEALRKAAQQHKAADNARQRIALTSEVLILQLERVTATCETLKRELRDAV